MEGAHPTQVLEPRAFNLLKFALNPEEEEEVSEGVVEEESSSS